MGSRDRDTKSFHDKLKVFFKKGASAPVAAQNELVVTAELRRELSLETPLSRRLRAIKEVGDRVLHIRVHEGGVEKIWSSTRDLLEDSNMESRHAVLSLFRNIAEGQTDLLVMRTVLFRFLRDTHAGHPSDDYVLRFKLLYALTNTGKDIKCFEEQIGPFLLEWLPQIQIPAHIIEFFNLVINVVKFNAVYLDEEIVHGIVNNACHLCVYSSEGGVVQGCLTLLQAVVSYSLLPRAALPTFVAALCRTVNIEHYCQNSWKLMRNVVGADMGHAALQEMVELVRGAARGRDAAGLARGAVFYINMALWGPRRVHTLHVSFLAVLPAFLKALSGRHAVVTYEVVMALQSLVARVHEQLHAVAWDLVLDIVRGVLEQDKTFDPPNELIHSRVHALISSMEALHEAGQFHGDAEALLDLIDLCGHDRPESSTMRLISIRCGALSGAAAGAALALAERYVRLEPRPAVRLHALACLVAYIKRHRCSHGEELSERVGGSVAAACALDADVSLRAAAARALPDLARMCSPDACIDLIDQLEKILNRPFEMYLSEVSIPREADTSELQAAAGALLELLHDKLLRAPAAPAARAFLVLLDHLDHHYRRPALLHHHPEIRLKIFDMLFALRANEFNCVGFCYDEKGCAVSGTGALRLRARCSALLLVEPPAPRASPPPAPRELPPGAVLLPAGRLARALPAALAREPDWAVLAHVLRALPPLLHARALALGRRAQDLDLLAATLCSMVSDRSLCLAGGPGAGKLLVSDFHAAALPSLAALASYHAYLEPQTQQRIVKCLLKYGMVLRSPQPYINALTMFTLETRDTMVKLLPEVLLDLSKISDTKAIASPMLEFLSTLTRLPRVYASFVEDQCMTVFAILLPYTNPSRYNHYVVSLAHHVIAAWFLKCRLAYRRNFVSFIINGLHNYIIVPFEEQYAHRATHQRSNEDSSNRQRSSSLGSRAVSHAPLSGSRGGAAARDSGSLATFHVELTETCIDLLARYTFTPCSVKPQRSDTAEFLFNGGQSTTWLVGHKLVTITTSGCLQNSIKQGLCERCATLCRRHAESASSALPGDAQMPDSCEQFGSLQPPPAEVKRYSKCSLQHSRSTETSCSSLSASEPPPSSGHSSRQNSAENKTTDPLLDALNQFTQRFEKVSKEVEGEEGGWSRVGELAAAGACPCWCARWAELHVRSPTGDVSWLLRMQNHISSSQLQEWPLQDVLALLAPPGLGAAAAPARPEPPDESPRAGPPAAPRGPAPDLHKSSSDSVVGDRRGRSSGARLGTQPINIPGSPQRQSSSSTTDDEDMLLTRPEGKSRHHVRRSNSSPEMSSLKGLSTREPDFELPPDNQHDREHDHHSHILLPICEPTSGPMSLHASKKANKKNDTRVSCEAIPEEMSGTSPQPHTHTNVQPHTHTNVQPHTHTNVQTDTHAHPHLMTYNSDPEPMTVMVTGAAGEAAADERAPSLPLQKTSSDSRVTPGLSATLEPRAVSDAEARVTSGALASRDELQPLSRSKRSNTISVMSPTRRNRELTRSTSGATSSSGGGGVGGSLSGAVGGGVSPSFVFLQLYHNMSTFPISPCVPGDPSAAGAGAAAGAGGAGGAAARPLKVSEAQHQRTIKNLDLVPPLETYKVGVLYVGPGQQDDEVAILKNEYGSVRYMEFLRQLGTLVPLEGADPNLFLNLERGGKDGRYTYVWSDDIMQVLFHVATAMPSSERDPTCNEKRKYIGNDFVSIVYNDSQQNFNIHTIKGQFNLCIVVVEPLAHGMHRVTLKTKDERLRTEFLAHAEPACVSDHNVALLARQHALHTALASQISQSLKPGREPYASNSLERLRLIKRLRARAMAARLARPAPPYAPGPAPLAIDDFNHYT